MVMATLKQSSKMERWAIVYYGLLVIATAIQVKGSAPRLDVAKSTVDRLTGEMKIIFDVQTNQGNFYGSRPCADLLSVTSPVRDFPLHMCRFTNDITLAIDAPVTSNWTDETEFKFKLPSPISSKFNATNKLTADGPFQLLLNTVRSAPPVPRIIGPTELPGCFEETFFQVSAEGSGGRLWKAATFNLIYPVGTLTGGNPGLSLETLGFSLDKSKLPPSITYLFSVTVINAFGFTQTSATFSLTTKLLSDVVPTAIRGSAMTKEFRSSDEIRLSAQSQVDPKCLPTNLPPSWNPSFQWQVALVPDDTTPFALGQLISLPLLDLSRSEIIIPPYTLRPKIGSVYNYYAVRVNITVPVVPAMRGFAVTYIAIKHSLPAMNLVAPSWIPKGAEIVIDATRSCNPDFVIDCDSRFGRRNLTAESWMRFQLDLEILNNDTQTYELPSPEYENDANSDGYWEIGRPWEGTYRLTMRYWRVQLVSEVFTIQKVIVVGADSATGGGSCMTPNFSLPIFSTSGDPEQSPNVVIQRDVPFILKASGMNPDNYTIVWTVRTSYLDGARVIASKAKALDRPALSLPSSIFVPGVSYTFSLTASANCGSGVATSFVSFTANVPPRGGAVSIKPSIGIAFITNFLISTGSWTVFDPAIQLPLTYEFQYLRKGTNSAFTLATASSSPFIVTKLSSAKPDCRVQPSLLSSMSNVSAVVVVARDALGASGTAFTTSFSIAPLFNSSTPVTTLNNQYLPLSVLDQARKAGANTEDQLRTLGILAEEAASTECVAKNRTLDEQQLLVDYRKQVSFQTLTLVQTVRNSLRTAGRPPPLTMISLLFAAYSSAMSGAFSSLGEDELSLASVLVTQLLEDALELGDINPSDTPIPLDFGPILLDALSGLAKSLRFERDESEGINPLEEDSRGRQKVGSPMATRNKFGSRMPPKTTSVRHTASVFKYGSKRLRSLRQGSDDDDCLWQCDIADGIKSAMRNLITLFMLNFEPGSDPRYIMGQDIELKLTREYRTLVGDSSGVSQLQLDQGPRFRLPKNILNDRRRLKNGTTLEPIGEHGSRPLPDTIDVCAIRFRFNPREMVGAANLPPGVDLTNGIYNLPVRGVVATNFSIEEVHTLLFLDMSDSNQGLDPYNLTENINITIPLPDSYEFPSDNSTQEVACGFWDESFQGWSAEGCTVLLVDPVNRTILCSCNHASDFAAWNAFLANIGGGDLGVVATIAIVVVALLMPGILMMWLLFFLWARNKDLEDSEAVHLGALVVLTKNRLKLHQQQRKFFRLLRENAQRPVGQISATKRNIESMEVDSGDASTFVPSSSANACVRCLRRASLIRNWLRAIYYEHSFFGIFTRFDPFYTRTQRLTVFVAVLVGNLFAASFFFDFKTTNDLSPGVLLASVIAAALVVAIPIKMFIRWLFRATELALGSPMHRVAQIYRISEFQAGDILPAYASEAERADSQMLYAFKDYYAIKSNIVALEYLLMELNRRDALVSRNSSQWFKCWIRALICKTWCRTRLRVSATVEQRRRSIVERLGIQQDDNGVLKRSELEKCLTQKQFDLLDAERALKEACERVNEEWAKVPKRPNVRVETMRKQQSRLLQFATLLYDETEDRARSREKSFRSWFIYVAWTIVLVYLIGCLAYCTNWVLRRTSYKGIQDPSTTQAEQEADANGVIVAWLASAAVGVLFGVFLSEPVIQFIRFSLIPWILRRFGNGTATMWRRNANAAKVGIAPSGDDLGKPVVAKPVVTLMSSANPSGVSSFDSISKSEPTVQETQTGEKKESYLAQHKKRSLESKKQGTSEKVLEAIAEIVEALA